MKTLRILCGLAVLCLGLSACRNTQYLYHRHQALDRHELLAGEYLVFNDSLAGKQLGESSSLELGVCLRYTASYPYQDLHLQVDMDWGERHYSFPVSLSVYRPDGSMKGASWGSYATLQQSVGRITLPTDSLSGRVPGRFQASIVSRMSDSSLPGIESLGLYLVR